MAVGLPALRLKAYVEARLGATTARTFHLTALDHERKGPRCIAFLEREFAREFPLLPGVSPRDCVCPVEWRFGSVVKFFAHDGYGFIAVGAADNDFFNPDFFASWGMLWAEEREEALRSLVGMPVKFRYMEGRGEHSLYPRVAVDSLTALCAFYVVANAPPIRFQRR